MPHVRRRRVDWFTIVNYTILILLSISFIAPFINLISTSIVSEEERFRRGMFILIPEHFDLYAYKILLRHGSHVYSAYMVTILRVVVGTACNLFFTILLAYGLAKRGMPFRNGIAMFVFFTMIFHGGLIPSYLLITNIGLRNSFWVMIIPGLISAFNFFIIRTFFLAIPQELEESAFMDGASPFVILWKLIVPLSMPSIVTVGLFYAVAHWNSWFDAVLYIKDNHKFPIQVVLNNILSTSTLDDEPQKFTNGRLPPVETLKAAMIVISTLPIVCVYPFIQKYFVKGAMIGAVKG
ncbi:ABC transporter permease [Paenibacillus pectinilyticus]|uniref:ABC transporter permease n=1 Tax=Paenibacillus pectinilyticus TaxID=512399 RepID=A0A1C0ZWU2_9BACL|nr:carbohydrate ABC transporter permease [Paenibacillus pectinilyticus]OCT12560.1 ABC transporter permease [Paenibacillus pectinilyticus]